MIVWGGVACVFIAAGALLLPAIAKNRAAADRLEAFGNLRSLTLCFLEFDSEFGEFPGAATARNVKASTGTPLTLGSTSSNQIFRQLIAYGLKSEKPFWACNAGPKRPDDNFRDDAHALVPGECGFAYVAGLSSSVHPDTPLLLTPMIPGTTLFDPGPFKGEALVSTVGGTTRLLPISSSGQVMFGGKDLFDLSQPFWHGKKPDLKWQE